jgi:hypothetical protein
MGDLPSEQLSQLSADYQNLADRLNLYLQNNASTLNLEQYQGLSQKIEQILDHSNEIAARSVIQSDQDISEELNSLTQSTANINSALKTIGNVQKVIDFADTVMDLGASVLSGDIKGITDNISNLSTGLANDVA